MTAIRVLLAERKGRAYLEARCKAKRAGTAAAQGTDGQRRRPLTDTAQKGRLDAQFAFLNEADRLKSVLRATTLVDGSRRENSGEHSWHLALYALVLADQAAPAWISTA